MKTLRPHPGRPSRAERAGGDRHPGRRRDRSERPGRASPSSSGGARPRAGARPHRHDRGQPGRQASRASDCRWPATAPTASRGTRSTHAARRLVPGDRRRGRRHDRRRRRRTPPRRSTTTTTCRAHAPLVFGVVLAMAFLLLLVTFRSIVIPIKAIMLNLLSVAAAFGVLTLVFQHGWGEIIGTAAHRRASSSWLPGVPVRDPVRPLDGLPRVHPQPHQGGLGQGHRPTRPPSSRASAARPASSPPRPPSWSRCSRSSRPSP